MTFAELKQKMTSDLEKAGVDNAAYDARELLLSAAGFSLEQYLAESRSEAPEDVVERARALTGRRGKREPLQYILGKADFYGYEFAVRPGVLIPRFDTETLVETALSFVHPGQKILDLCTGSGCIILTVLLEAARKFDKGLGSGKISAGILSDDDGKAAEGITGVGADISNTALRTAKENARRLGVENVSFVKSDLYENLSDRYDILLSNPPYIRTGDIGALSPEVKDYEPHLALDGSDDGLSFYRRIAEGAPGHLTTGGRIFLEIGFDEAADVAGILTERHFKDVEVHKDLSGRDRVVSGRYDGNNG